MTEEIERTRIDIYIHLVWATYRRLPLITSDRERQIHRLLGSEAAGLNCRVLAIGGLEDHLHVLVKCPSTVAPAQLVKRMKGISSRSLGTDVATGPFKWQDGYSATSLHRSLIRRTMGYINTQKERHATGKIWDELECEA